MNYPLFIARKLSLTSGSKKQAPAVSVAIAAIALAATIMLIAIAIVLGFKNEIREKIIGFNGHITVYALPTSEEDTNIITLNDQLKENLLSIPYIKDFALQAAIPAILKTETDFKGVYLKGLNGENANSLITKNLEEGFIPDFSVEENKTKIIISRKAARQLSLKGGDKIDTYFISDDIRVRRLEVAGIYNSHFDQYDDIIIYGALQLVQQLGGIESDQGTFLQISVDNFDYIPDYTLLIQNALNAQNYQGNQMYRADNVLNQGISYFSWLSLLDTNVIVILVLMTVVGAVTIISGLLIIILEKRRFIGLMKSLGAPFSKIRKIFIYIALKISIIGLIIGNSLTLIFLYFQDRYHFIPLDPESYYIDFVPVRISWEYLVALNIGILIIVYCVLILPSRFISKISPSETMRYE